MNELAGKITRAVAENENRVGIFVDLSNGLHGNSKSYNFVKKLNAIVMHG